MQVDATSRRKAT